MFAVQGVYDGTVVSFTEPVPVKEKFDVVVTFLKPLELKAAERDVSKMDDEEFEKFKEAEIATIIAEHEAVFGPIRQDEETQRKMAALKRLVGLTRKNPVSLEEARAERLARQCR